MTFINCHVHSHLSLLDGLSKTDQIASRCVELGQTTCALTDHGSISGAATFMKECKKQEIKPILGCEFYCTESSSTIKDKNNLVSHQVILAKNYKGWLKLIQLISASNDLDRFYYKPRIDLDLLISVAGDGLVSFSGHLGSTLALRSGSMPDMEKYSKVMQEVFGKDNFFLEVQLVDSKNSIEMVKQANIIRELSSRTGIPCIATGDAHYCKPEDAVDQRVLLCSSLQLTMMDVRKQLQNGTCPMSSFFKTDAFHLPSESYIKLCGNTEEEINNTALIADMCESYDITGPPKLPKFACPNGMDENSYLRQLCVEGWRKKNKEWNKDVYGDRVKHELNVIKEANLAGYFLIVQDYVNWGKNQGWLIGPGRGSAAGCLVAYLLGITNIDPLKYGLIFERFYNAGRNTADRISLPDIDVDFPITKRKMVIDYLRDKYGTDRVCQMATFGRMQGRGALKEVLRVNNACDFETMNVITKSIPQESEISDQLEESGEKSIIKWKLTNEPEDLIDWCVINEDDTLSGEYSNYFAQAIRLEGTYKSQGKHAAGVIIAAEPLDKICPMIHDKNGTEKIAGMAMEDMESMGHVKVDVLGVAILDKLMGVNSLLMKGKIE
jgi:DNA polymerase-3 subunit alpha